MTFHCKVLIVLLLVVKTALGQPANFDRTEIVFVSDTQAPLWFEHLYLKSNHNRLATKEIFGDILLRNPAAVYLLGDVVAIGTSDRQWKPMDIYLQNLRNNGTQINACLGNHDVLRTPAKGEKKFQQRFPDHLKTGSLNITDSVAVILLNSNFKSLSPQEDSAQTRWYRNTLSNLDSDNAVKCIITGCHHSPFTNSRLVKSSMGVRQRFLSSFLGSKKSGVFLSGHSHNFEHFKQYGKDFFVIGGGGGLHQPLKHGRGIIPDVSAAYKPMFHYLAVQRCGSQLLLTSIMLQPDFSGFKTGAAFIINNTSTNH